MLECSVQKVFQINVGGLADVCCDPPHLCLAVPVQDLPEIAVTNAIKVRLESFPERFICFRVDSQLRG